MRLALGALSILLALPAAAADLDFDPQALGSIREGFQDLQAQTAPPAGPAGIACARPMQVAVHVRGSYFRKVESLPDLKETGIRGALVLPQVVFDPDRFLPPKPGQPVYREGPLDRPSAYLGAHTAAKEVDAGLAWDRVYDGKGRPTFTDLPEGTDGRDASHRFLVAESGGKKLQPNFAFRPFWRTTLGSGNQWHNPPKNDPYYYYPGEIVVMALRVKSDGAMRLDIRSDTGRAFKTAFAQDGFTAQEPRSLKRIVAIDQSGNEGLDVQPTRTQVVGARWLSVDLLRGHDVAALAGDECQEVVGGDTAADYTDIFDITGLPEGGEALAIRPPRP